jgi:hypothetical protein
MEKAQTSLEDGQGFKAEEQAVKRSSLVRRTPLRNRGRPRPVRNEDPAKRAWIRQFACVMKDHPEHKCVGVTQCCHEKHGVHKDDRRMLPGCAQFHTEDHAGRKKLEKKLGFTFTELCVVFDDAWMQQTWANDPGPAA